MRKDEIKEILKDIVFNKKKALLTSQLINDDRDESHAEYLINELLVLKYDNQFLFDSVLAIGKHDKIVLYPKLHVVKLYIKKSKWLNLFSWEKFNNYMDSVKRVSNYLAVIGGVVWFVYEKRFYILSFFE